MASRHIPSNLNHLDSIATSKYSKINYYPKRTSPMNRFKDKPLRPVFLTIPKVPLQRVRPFKQQLLSHLSKHTHNSSKITHLQLKATLAKLGVNLTGSQALQAVVH